MKVHRILWLLVPLLLLVRLAGCDSASAPAPHAETGEVEAQPPPPLLPDPPPVPARRPPLPPAAIVAPVDHAGGEVTLGPVRIWLAPGELDGPGQLAIWSEVGEAQLLEGYEERITEFGEPFGIDLRGESSIDGSIHIEFAYDPVAVPEGWEVYLLHRSDGGRESIPATDRQLLALAPQPLPWGVICAQRTPGRLTTQLPAYMGQHHPDYTHYIQPVLARRFADRHLADADGRTWLCIYLVDPPAYEADAYLDKLAAAFTAARERAGGLGVPAPSQPTVVTVRRGMGTPSGLAIGNLIILRNDLDRMQPYVGDALLETVAAHEYMHIIQANMMTTPTWDEPLNDSLTEGGAEWFAWSTAGLHESRGWSNSAFEELRYSAAPFWLYLHERYGPEVMRDILHLSLRRSSRTPASLASDVFPMPYGLFYDRSYATEMTDYVLQRHGMTLGDAYADFAAGYLYRRDIAPGPMPKVTPLGVLHEFQPYDFPAFEPWSVVSVTGTNPRDRAKGTAGAGIEKELCAAAYRIISPVQRGRLNIEIEPPLVYEGAALPRQIGPPRIHVFLYGERAEQEPKLLFSGLLPIDGKLITIPDFGLNGEFESAAIILANTAWSRRGPESGGGVVEIDYGGLSHFRFSAFLDEHRPLRRPADMYVNVVGAGQKWTVSQHRETDENGKRCFGTIMNAIQDDDVEDGDDISIDPGTYEETVVLTKGVTLRAKIAGTVTVAAPGTVIAIGEEGGGAQIANLTLIGGGPTVPVVRISRANDVTISGNIIISEWEGIVATQGADLAIGSNWVATGHGGIRANNVRGVAIGRNIVSPPVGMSEEDAQEGITVRMEQPPYQITDRGVLLRSAKSGVIGNANTAIDVSGCEGVTVSENEVLSAVTFERGISVSGSSAAQVVDNLVCAKDGIYIGSLANAVVRGNRSYGGVNGNGLRTHRCTGLTISQNVLGGSVSAINLHETNDTTLRHNTLLGGAEAAMLLSKVRNLTTFMDDIDGTGRKRGTIYGAGPARHGISARDSGGIFIQKSNLLGNHAAAHFVDCDGIFIEDSRLRHLKPARSGADVAAISLINSEQTRLRNLVVHDSERGVYVKGGTVAMCEGIHMHGVDTAFTVRSANLSANDILYAPLSGGVLADAGEDAEITLSDMRIGGSDVPPLAVVHRLNLLEGIFAAFSPGACQAPLNGSLYVAQLWQVEPVKDGRFRMRAEFDLTGIQSPLAGIAPAGLELRRYTAKDGEQPAGTIAADGRPVIQAQGTTAEGFAIVAPTPPDPPADPPP